MEDLTGRIRDYAWGSRTAIAGLQGRPVPSPGPEAELWLGAHPDDPALLGGGTTLVDAIKADPAGLLGVEVVEEFGARLPYLLKVLAAAAPLSLQAHPNADQARTAFAAGRPGYLDPHHKPELLVAVEEFDALCGFRDPEESAAVLASFEVAALRPVLAALRTGGTGDRLRAAVELLMGWPAGERAELVTAVADADRALAEQEGPAPGGYGLAGFLADRYPGDVGVLVALLLNRVRLAPDEAVWMPAGNLHAYLAGFGVEIMAASDNVLRGGLTPKPMDVPGLLEVLRFEVLPDPVLTAVTLAPGVLTWPVPVADFGLHKTSVAAGEARLPGGGPRIVLGLTGPVEVRAAGSVRTLAPGAAVFVAAGEPPVTVTGTGQVFQAGVGVPGAS